LFATLTVSLETQRVVLTLHELRGEGDEAQPGLELDLRIGLSR